MTDTRADEEVIRGRCAYAECEALEDEELVAQLCSVCYKWVHHFCSNLVLDGSLSTRACSSFCKELLTKKEASVRSAVPAQVVGVVESQSQTVKRVKATKTNRNRGQIHAKQGIESTASSHSGRSNLTRVRSTTRQATLTKSQRPTIDKAVRKMRHKSSVSVVQHAVEQKAAESCPVVVPFVAASTTANNPITDASNVTTMPQDNCAEAYDDFQDLECEHGNLSCSDRSACSMSDFESVERESQERRASANAQTAPEDIRTITRAATTKGARKKKFFFTPDADLALLKEILAVEPFAAAHGQIGKRYQRVAENVSEHFKLDVTLSSRTVSERFFLLLDEFKAEDHSSRKKFGTAESYDELQQLLQDISDRMRDAKEAKAAKKYKKKAKAIQLKTQGEILREKAVKRRSQWNSDGVHNSALPDENSAAEANVSSTSSKQKSTKMTRVDASMGAYLELQMLNRKEDNTFLQHQIELKKRKIENEATRWAQEFQLKQAQQALDQKKWNDDVDLRRKEMQLRREELALMRLQFDSQRK